MLRAGDAVENESSLAERLGISRLTVRAAMTELVAQGLVVRRRGIGTVVANEVIRRRREISTLYGDCEPASEGPVTVVLQFSTSWVDVRASVALGLAPATPLVYLKRLRWAAGAPVSITRNWLPPKWVDLDLNLLGTLGLYQVMQSRGAVPAVVRQTVAARIARPDECCLLRTERGQPVLSMSRTSYDVNGQVVELGEDTSRSDRGPFRATIYG